MNRQSVSAGWAIRNAVAEFGVSPHAIMGAYANGMDGLCLRESQSARRRYKPVIKASVKVDRNSNEEVIRAVAESWAETRRAHRLLAFDFAHNSLKAAAKQVCRSRLGETRRWPTAAAPQSAGLDSEEGSRIQIGLALIETRPQAINLPRGCGGLTPPGSRQLRSKGTCKRRRGTRQHSDRFVRHCLRASSFKSPPKDDRWGSCCWGSRLRSQAVKRACCQQAWPSARLSKGGEGRFGHQALCPLPFTGQLAQNVV